MTKETDFMVQSLFQRESMDEMTLDELRRHAEAFPYSSIIQFLYTCKLKSQYHLDFHEVEGVEGLNLPAEGRGVEEVDFDENEGGFHDPAIVQAIEKIELQDPNTNPASGTNKDFEFQLTPYHTVDYFASLGIKINMENEKDELSLKVKSFTAWLKTMKRLQPGPETVTVKDIQSILNTQNDKENQPEAILTEAMAEVYLKQGLREKAIDVYNKLSLQNPLNSHKFADKISQIKENKI